jgi:Flp pilus assembly protein TadG
MMSRRFTSRILQHGVAAVEAAFLVIPLVILLLGVAELGRIFYQYNTIAKATRDGARYLSEMAPGTGHAAAKCLVVTGSPSCAGGPLVEGLAVDNVTICDATTCPATHASVHADGSGVPVMNLVTVTVTGYRSANYVPVPLASIKFDPISTTMRQAL